MSPDAAVGWISAAGGVVSAAVSAGIFWGLTSSKFSQLIKDVSSIKQVLALEPSDGEIKSAFPSRLECVLRESRSDDRLDACENRIERHEHRLTAVETNVNAPRRE